MKTTVQETTDALRTIHSYLEDQGHDYFNQFNTIEDKCRKIVSEVKPHRKITEYIECVDLPKRTQMVTQIATQVD
jgi:hypothetical protein